MMDTLQDVFRGSSAKETDYIQYAVYLPKKDDESDMTASLKDALDMINSHVQPIINGYLWQKDKFHLSLAYDQGQDPSYPFLFGASRFGDCVNDEWFIVYLLKTVSSLIPDSVISLVDNDGDVLLIEAALDIPAWLDPSNSQNRVYLYNGQVHIIPLPTSPADILQATSGPLMRQKAIDLIRSNSKNTLASAAIQQAIMDRISEYPSAAMKEIHRAGCILPNQAAFVLLSEPQLITLAIEAFYLRDPISMKACASMKTFSPQSGLTETVIQFTKTTYAQTVSQKFYAPKPFRLPSVKEKKQFKFAELGMKVACGLEMLYHSSTATASDHADDDTIDTYDFDNDHKYTAYAAHLEKLGYFRSERKGSQLYGLLEKQSKEQYLEYKKKEQDQVGKKYVSLDDLDVEDEASTFDGSSHVLSTPGQSVKQRIDALLAHYSQEALNKLLSVNPHVEDSDDWMNVDPQQLEELLMKRMGNMNQSMMADLQKDFSSDGDKNMDETMDLEAIMSNLEHFVENSKSGIDGVEFPSNTRMEDEDDDSEDDDYSDDGDDEGAIQFDMDKFMRILRGVPSATDRQEKEEHDLSHVMEEMDQEIYSHDKISGSFAKLTVAESSKNEDDVEEDEEAPVDVQLNLVKNVLESFKSQQGLPGPVGNMLSQFGFVLPGDNEQDD
ncbi:suppressor of S. cerevisiae gcr2 isoform 1 [Mucor ambiguus]|uniref:Suppressor of S. cerevisiae gcr2 isoform 1 n=1 Tax=Mucor ambiguus TaxID=91626 RepID=A0A0C9MF53_9FUNG|nr:suppressor of S. cerevisiae gcr2 isoform 1 [Mucor ambiguus]